MQVDSQTINEIKDLANRLISTMKQRKSKYPFSTNHTEKLLGAWRHMNPKHTIHLTDLPEDLIVDFDEYGQKIMNRRSSGIEIRTINSHAISPSIDTLEKHITSIRTRSSKTFKINGFPINLTDENWAYVIGCLPDAGIERFDLYSNDCGRLAEMREKLNLIGNQFSIFDNRVVGNRIFARLVSIGIGKCKENDADNVVLPYWIFSETSDRYKIILVAKIFESEGYFNNNSRQITITQSNKICLTKNEEQIITQLSKPYIIQRSGTKILKLNIGRIPENIQVTISSQPSLLLISLQLLLKKMEINSTVNPEFIYIKSNNAVKVMWNLRIFGEDMNKFVRMCTPYIVTDKFALFSKRRQCLSRNTRFSFYLTGAKDIESQLGYFTVKLIIQKTGRCKKSVYNTIPLLRKAGLIKNIGSIGKENSYRITSEGLKRL